MDEMKRIAFDNVPPPLMVFGEEVFEVGDGRVNLNMVYGETLHFASGKENKMRAWILAASFGIIGAVLGKIATDGAGVGSASPLWALSGGAWFAILGAILGGTADIVSAINSGHTQRIVNTNR